MRLTAASRLHTFLENPLVNRVTLDKLREDTKALASFRLSGFKLYHYQKIDKRSCVHHSNDDHLETEG
jgi:hypothetical protein